MINFPEGTYRRSIAAYAYSVNSDPLLKPRSTKWSPSQGSVFKKALGTAWPQLVSLKNKLLGSGTSKNQ